MVITTFTAVILLFSFHLFTAKDFKAPWTSRNIHKDPPKKTFQSKTNENVDAQVETLQQDIKKIMDMLQQTIQNKIERNRGDETTGTPEPEKLLSTVTEGNKPIAAQTTAAQTTAAATTAAATTATATTAATITKVLKAKKKGDGTNSDTKNLLTKTKDLLSKKLKLFETKFDEKLKAVQQSFQNLPGKDETTETPHPTVTERTNSDIENASEKTIQRLISKELNELETNFVENLKPTQPAMQTKSESFQKHPVEDETTKTPVPEKQPPIVTECYDAPTDLVYNPASWNFDSGQLSWKGNRSHVPITKFKVIKFCHAPPPLSKFNKTCPDKEFKPYRTWQNESIELKNLLKGRQNIFAVQFNMINGCHGKMGKFPIFTVPDEENINGNSPSETHPLSKTGIDAKTVLKAQLVIALAVILALFIVRHKRNQRSSRTFASSHYDSCSGITTFTAANELAFMS